MKSIPQRVEVNEGHGESNTSRGNNPPTLKGHLRSMWAETRKVETLLLLFLFAKLAARLDIFFKLSVSRLCNVGGRVINECGAAGVMRNGRGNRSRGK
jgi:hypothetical protein